MNSDGEDEEDVTAAEAARRAFFLSSGSPKNFFNCRDNKRATAVQATGEGFFREKQKRKSGAITNVTTPMKTPTFMHQSPSNSKRASMHLNNNNDNNVSDTSFMLRNNNNNKQGQSFSSFQTKIPTTTKTTTMTNNNNNHNNNHNNNNSSSLGTTTSSMLDTIAMTRDDLPRGKHNHNNAQQTLNNNEEKKNKRLKKRILLDALRGGSFQQEADADEFEINTPYSKETNNNNKKKNDSANIPSWVKQQLDSRNVSRGEELVTNRLPRATNIDTETHAELIPDVSSLFIPTGALEQLPPFARFYWSVKSQMMDCLMCIQVGRFFNLFQNDADTGESIGLRLNGKNKGFMRKVGFPTYTFEDWATKLIAHGYSVAKCAEGKEIDPKRKLCERKVVEIITPSLNKGLLIDDVDQSSWACLLAQEGDSLGICLIDADKGNVKFGSIKITRNKKKKKEEEGYDEEENNNKKDDDDETSFAKLVSILTQTRPKEIIISMRGPNACSSNVKRAIKRHYVSVSAGAFASNEELARYDDFDDDNDKNINEDSYANHASLRNNPVIRVLERGCDPLPSINILDVKRAIRQYAGEAEFETDTDTRRAVESCGNAGLIALAFGIRFCAWAGQSDAIFKSAKYDTLASLINIDAQEYGDLNQRDGSSSRRTMLEFHGNALKELNVTQGGKNSLIASLSRDCTTPHGKRRVRDMVFCPLVSISDIMARQDAIQFLLKDFSGGGGQHNQEQKYAMRDYLKRKLPHGDCERSLTKCLNLAHNCASMIDANANVLIDGTDPSSILKRDAVISLTAATIGGATGSDEVFADAMESLNEGETLDDALVAFWETNQPRLDGFSKAVECLMILAKALKGLQNFCVDLHPPSAENNVVPKIIEQAIAFGETACPLLEDVREALRVDKINDEENAHRKIRIVTPDKRAFKTYAQADADATEADHERNMRRAKKNEERNFEIERYQMAKNDDEEEIENRIVEDERAAFLFDRADRAGARAFTTVIAQFAAHKRLWRALIGIGADIDALNSFSRLKAEDDLMEFCVPRFLKPRDCNGTPIISMNHFWHPLLDSSRGQIIVKNNAQFGGCSLDEADQPIECPRFALLSGPNMGGKTTLARAIGLTVILAQIGAHVPASECVLTPMNQLVVRCGTLRDDLQSGVSTFLAETTACATAMKVALQNTFSLLIMDEIGQGTSTSDGYAIASAVARSLMKSNTAITLFTTHFHDLHEHLASSSALCFKSCHMSSEINEKTRDVVKYNYELCDGAAPFGSCGLSVARLAGLDGRIIANAQRVAQTLQSTRRLSIQEADDLVPREVYSAFKQLLRNPGINGHAAVQKNEREWAIEFYQFWTYVQRLLHK